MSKAPIVVAAGGTGGHFYPAEALAAELQRRGERVVLFTDARSGGLASQVFARAEKHVISGAGLAGRGAKRAVQGVFALLRGIAEAYSILKNLKPKAVVAFGGYPAVPPVMASVLLHPRPRIVLHEQNAVLGRANRMLGRAADVLALNFANTQRIPAKSRVVVVGNPVRPAITALQGQGYTAPRERIELLVLGGSLGAKVFGTLVPQALALLPADLRRRLHVTQQCRTEELEAARQVLKEAGISAELSPFFTDVAGLLAKAHLLVARAGASTVAETAVAGRPAIFIPLPGAIDDHQRANAQALAEAGGAWVMDQAGLTPQALAGKLDMLLTYTELLQTAAAASAAVGRADAASRLADIVLEGISA
jgi:UDP-N-acetylglucosamine--N-acetylmuramyl-(pentapeptide) pyrophosphoryl-undecaprenol N-acetylglucosamine transferase